LPEDEGDQETGTEAPQGTEVSEAPQGAQMPEVGSEITTRAQAVYQARSPVTPARRG